VSSCDFEPNTFLSTLNILYNNPISTILLFIVVVFFNRFILFLIALLEAEYTFLQFLRINIEYYIEIFSLYTYIYIY